MTTLDQLAQTIKARRAASATASYTKSLLEAGPEKCARKFGEEAIETVIAGVQGDRSALKAEAADVVYHLLVLLEVHDVPFSDVTKVLEARLGTSGHDEKAARPRETGGG